MIAVCLTIPEGLMTTTISIESICVTRNYDLEHPEYQEYAGRKLSGSFLNYVIIRSSCRDTV